MCYDIDFEIDVENDAPMQYESDERTLTMEDLEKILCKEYGASEYDRTAGCGCYGGKWFSIDNILNVVSDYVF